MVDVIYNTLAKVNSKGKLAHTCVTYSSVCISFGQSYLNTDKVIRDWLLIKEGGGGHRRRGGPVKFYPYEKMGGGVEKVLAIDW